MRGRVLTLTMLLCGLVAAPMAQGADLPKQTLRSVKQIVRWKGKSLDPTGQGYGPPTQESCTTDSCDTMVLDVKLPAGTFTKAPKSPTPPGTTRVYNAGATDMPGDGILIAIKWPTEFDQWNVYVDDLSTGKTVAQGIDLDSNSQSVLLSKPHNGLYRIRIVPFYTDFYKQDLDYQGEALVFHDPTQRHRKRTALLPSIDTVAPHSFHIADVPPVFSNPTGWRFTPDGTFDNSCYLDETAQFGSTRCLRFDNDIRNTGQGPLILRFEYTPDAFVNNCKMTQEIIRSDGTVAQRGAGPCMFHPQHAHFHYTNMGRYQLYAVGSNGLPGATPVAESKKVGFCTVDVDNYSFGRRGDVQRPRVYSFPTCNVPNAYGPGEPPEYMGISAGWGDVYTWDLPQQYLDISDTNKVPDGLYEVVSRSNPDGGILTADRGKETAVTCIRLAGTKVKILHELPSQSNASPLPPCNGRASHKPHRGKRPHRH